MAGYLDQYGKGDAERESLIRWGLLAALGVIVLSVVLFYAFRHFPERQKLDGFLDSLKAGNFEQAYTFWGCSKEKPCRDYKWESFLRDWGPEGEYKPAREGRISERYSCQDGILRTIDLGGGKGVDVMVTKGDRLLTFAPPREMWKGCTILP
jgi:hypothetical protein